MTKRLMRGLVLGALALAGCDGSEKEDDDCQTQDGWICAKDLHGFTFATDAQMISDYCAALDGPCVDLHPPTGATTVSMTHPEPGKLCLSGWMSQGGFAILLVDYARLDDGATAILSSLDAPAKGITHVAFTIDAVPEQELWLNAHSVQQDSCPNGPLDCFYPPNYRYRQITAPGRITAPLAAFKSENDPNEGLDTSRLVDIFLQLGGTSTGDYAFCISDYQLLDADGAAVKP